MTILFMQFVGVDRYNLYPPLIRTENEVMVKHHESTIIYIVPREVPHYEMWLFIVLSYILF